MYSLNKDMTDSMMAVMDIHFCLFKLAISFFSLINSILFFDS